MNCWWSHRGRRAVQADGTDFRLETRAESIKADAVKRSAYFDCRDTSLCCYVPELDGVVV